MYFLLDTISRRRVIEACGTQVTIEHNGFAFCVRCVNPQAETFHCSVHNIGCDTVIDSEYYGNWDSMIADIRNYF